MREHIQRARKLLARKLARKRYLPFQQTCHQLTCVAFGAIEYGRPLFDSEKQNFEFNKTVLEPSAPWWITRFQLWLIRVYVDRYAK